MRANLNPARPVPSLCLPQLGQRPRSHLPFRSIATPLSLAYNLTLNPPFDTLKQIIVHTEKNKKLNNRACRITKKT